MPKMATKAADNVFYKARIAAASWNDRLGSREGASEVTGIDRTRLANIELGTINPHPEEVLMLSDTYNAPELQNHFCSHLCPLGIGTISPIELEELERVTLQLISAMKSLPEVKDGIIDIFIVDTPLRFGSRDALSGVSAVASGHRQAGLDVGFTCAGLGVLPHVDGVSSSPKPVCKAAGLRLGRLPNAERETGFVVQNLVTLHRLHLLSLCSHAST